jgi:hypothetical protein
LEREEIQDLYFFEEQFIHWFDDTHSNYIIEICVDGELVFRTPQLLVYDAGLGCSVIKTADEILGQLKAQ